MTSDDYTRQIADLILQGGQIQAQRAQIPGKGRIIATSLAQLANIIPQVTQLRQQEQAQRQAAQIAGEDRDLKRRYTEAQIADLENKGGVDPLDQETKQLTLAQKKLETAGRVLVNTNAQNYPARRALLLSMLGQDAASQFPETYPGDDWRDAAIDGAIETGKQIEAKLKPPPALVPIPGPEGSPVYGTPVPGQPVYEKPPVERPQSLVPVPGPNGPVYGTPTPGAPVYERPRAPTAAGAAGDAGGLDPDAVDYTATQYRVLGPSGIPTRIETADRVKILNTAAKQAKSLGQTPAQAVQKQAAFKSDAAALNQMRKMSSSAQAYENKALEQAELVRDLSNKVPRTAYPIINGALLAGKQFIAGDTDTQLLFNALSTFTAEYAKIMEGSTGSAAASSDAARRAAADLISPALAKGTLSATIDQMKKEMGWTLQGYDATINQITERMGGAAVTPAAVESPPGAGISYQDYLKAKGQR